MEKQKKLLNVMVGILALAVGYALWDYPQQQEVAAVAPAPKPAGRKPARQSVAAPAEGEYRIRFDWLAAGGDFRGAAQDLFGPLREPPKPLPPPRRETAPDAGQKSAVPVPGGAEQLKYLGYLKVDRQQRFFVSHRDAVFVARLNEPFGKEREFRIRRADPKAIHLQRQGSDTLMEVPLMEAAPLATVPKAWPRSKAQPIGSEPSPVVMGSEKAPMMEEFHQEQEPVSDEAEEPTPEPAERKIEDGGEKPSVPGVAVPGDWITEEKR
ncbi:MAG: hypothetical protein JXB25_04745 [Deltaproteobacteria bacterium]|nr:hypothetical protein [Deltaproteobacteria bacterium]